MTLHLIEPVLGRISGGLAFNRALTEASERRIVRHPVPGDWTRPGEAEAAAVAGAIRAGAGPILLDGLIAVGLPGIVESAGSGHQPRPVHVIVHSLAGDSPEPTAETERERRALSSAAGVVTTSRFTAARLSSRYGIRAEVARPGNRARAQSVGETGEHFLCIGAITPNKGQLLLAEALRDLGETPLDWRCSFAGPVADSAYEQRLRTACTLLPTHSTEILGELPAPDIDALLGRADLLLLPSRAEAYGMVVAEAAAAGVPAFVTAGTGAEEPLRAGIALPHEPAAWTRALHRWAEDSLFRTRLQSEARDQRTQAVRDWAETVDEVMAAVSTFGGDP
ncbi:glycosyltransferase [Brevibacterium sp. FAM 27836]|uniref:glycosyltransferase n=1 Tax=Brevibacterium sp. FAM 27836 TaxID=3446693 RepID=UPI003F5148D5